MELAACAAMAAAEWPEAVDDAEDGTAPFHRCVLHATHFTLRGRYVDPVSIGAGAFGHVVSVMDKYTRTRVAIKKLAKPFKSAEHAKRTFRELRILQHLKGNPLNNVLQLLDIYTPDESAASLTEIYIVTDLAPCTLKMLLKQQQLSEPQIRLVIYRLLVGLRYIHSSGIMHRDLKPSNIAVWPTLAVKILDFGLARQVVGEEEEQQDQTLTPYVVTRWWRAPEVIALPGLYTAKADVWSIGCILAECFRRRALFQGTDHMSQMRAILDKLGPPPDSFLEQIPSASARHFIAALASKERQEFSSFIPGASEDALEVAEQLLAMDPNDRCSATDILKDPWFDCYHDEAFEPECSKIGEGTGTLKMTTNEWRDRVFDLIASAQVTLPVPATKSPDTQTTFMARAAQRQDSETPAAANATPGSDVKHPDHPTAAWMDVV